MGEVVPAYSSLASVYDRWMVDVSDYDAMAARCTGLLTDVQEPRVLDVCVGTGVLALALANAGAHVVGIDASTEMLAVASDRLAGIDPPCELRRLDVTRDPWPDGPWDLVTITGDSMNYFTPAELGAVLGHIGRSLAPTGCALFDLNTPTKLVEVFADTTYARSFADFAYIWENRLDPGRKHIDFEITLFQRERGSRWLRAVELHRQFVHPFDQVVRLAANAGLRLGRVTAGYADDRPVAPDAMRWVIEARRS